MELIRSKAVFQIAVKKGRSAGWIWLCLIAATILLLPQDARSNQDGLILNTERPIVFSSFFPFAATVEISLIEKEFVPREVRAKPGDTIRICNKDPFIHLPFSFSKYNQFGNPKGVRIEPGQCILSLVVQNPTKIDLCVKLNDELHSKEKGIIWVSPDGVNFSWAGLWNIVQTVPDGTKYTGIMKLEQNGDTVTGLVDWDLHTQGKLSGKITECNMIDFTLEYRGGMVGKYFGTLNEIGIEIHNGTARSNTGGPELTWSAAR